MTNFRAENFDRTRTKETPALPELRSLVRSAMLALRFKFWLILLSIFAMLCVALGLNFLSDQYYRAQASIVIDPTAADTIGQSLVPSMVFADALVVDTEIEIMQSREILAKVAQEPYARERAVEALAARGVQAPTDALVRAEALKFIRQNLSVNRETRTFVIKIAYVADDPEIAMKTVNAIAEAYIVSKTQARIALADAAGDWLREQINEISEQTELAKEQAQIFRLNNALPEEDSLSKLAQQLERNETLLIELRGKLADERADIAIIELALARLEENASIDFAYLSDLLQAPELKSLGFRLAEGLEEGDQDESSLLVTALKRQIAEALRNARANRESSIEIITVQQETLQAEAEELRLEITAFVGIQAEFNRFERAIEAMEYEEARLRERFQQTQRSERYFVGSARVIEWASIPQVPSNPSQRRLLAACLVGGVIIGLALIFAFEQANNSARSSKDIVEHLGFPFFGALPKVVFKRAADVDDVFCGPAKKLPRRKRLELMNFTYAQSFPNTRYTSVLRRILFEGTRTRQQSMQSIGVISAMSDEGCSTLASNLAVFDNRKTVLVVTNSAIFDLWKATASGMANAPSPHGAPTNLVRVTPDLAVYGLHLSEAKATEPLTLSDLECELSATGDAFDVAIVDVPALAYTNDVSRYAALITHGILAMSWNKTPLDVVKSVLEVNPLLAEKVIGVCLTNAKETWIDRFEGVPRRRSVLANWV